MTENLSRGRAVPVVKRYNIDIADSCTFPATFFIGSTSTDNKDETKIENEANK